MSSLFSPSIAGFRLEKELKRGGGGGGGQGGHRLLTEKYPGTIC